MPTNPSVSYETDGVQTDWTFNFSYEDQSYVKVSLDGELTTSFTWVNQNTIRISPARPVGEDLRIYRETDTDPAVVWADGAIILGANLNKATKQALHVSEEARFIAETAEERANTNLQAVQASASAAAASASAAATSANNAANSASTAAGHATTALNHANTAAGHVSTAAGHVSTAAGHVSTAAGHASTALGHANTAANHAAAASDYVDTAAGHASAAGASASAASGSASSASASASTATTKANEAAASATTALNHANAAAASAASAASSATNAITALDNFDDRYLGQKSSDPTVDNDGNALVVGALYFNTTTNKMRTWTGTSWSVTFSDSSAASAVTNDSAVSGATVKDALETLNTGKQSTNASLTAIINGAASNDGRFLACASGSLQYTKALAAGALTASDPYTWTTTFNNAGVTFVGYSFDITDTASAAGSDAFRVRVGGVTLLAVQKSGGVYSPGLNGFTFTGTALQAANSRDILFNGTAVGRVIWNSDLFLRRHAAATLNLGDTDAASPVSQTIRTQGSRAGTDSNVGGGNLTIQSGAGTGTGTPSSLIFQTPIAVGSGNGAQTMTTGLTINNGAARLASYTTAGRPAAATVGAGALVYVSDLAGGAAPQYSDGSAWQNFGGAATGPIPLYGLTMSNGTDATNDIDVAAGGCSDDTYAGRLTMSATCVKQLDVAFAEYSNPATPSGGRAAADNTTGAKWFHVFLIGGSGKNTQPFFATSLTPSLPSGFTTKRRIGSIYWTGSTIRGFVQINDMFMWKATVQDLNGNVAESRTNITVSVPGGVRCSYWAVASTGGTTPGARLYVYSPEVDDAVPGKQNAQLSVNGVDGFQQAEFHALTNTSSQVSVRTSTFGGYEIHAKGYRDLGIGN